MNEKWKKKINHEEQRFFVCSRSFEKGINLEIK